MTSAVEERGKKLPVTPWGYLPPRIRTLFVAGTQRTGGWLADAFAADSASEVVLEEAMGMASGVARLRDEVFDAVLISHEVPDLDALELLDALRAGGGDEQPLVVLGMQSEQEMSALCFEAGADAYVCVNTTTTRTLIWTVARAIERRRLISENRRLQQNESHRRQLEQDEAGRLLRQQRAMIASQAWTGDEQPQQNDDTEDRPTTCPELPPQLVHHYRELLRTYVIMGSGNLADEMRRLVELLASAGINSRQAMLLHLHVLEEMIQGLGNRSARHVMTRADMLILEMMMHLAECYRRRLRDQLRPPRQLLLPGFDAPAVSAFPAPLGATA